MGNRLRQPKDSDGRSAVETPTSEQLLGFFFPIHYQLGFELEDILRRGVLTRKQATILWLIRSEGGAQRSVPRKRVEALLTSWYEVTSSAITKAIRGMSRAPLDLVRIEDDPDSGRERRIVLTSKGRRFVEAMAEDGRRFATDLVQRLESEEIQAGIRFLSSLTDGLQRMRSARMERTSEPIHTAGRR
jgi:DNA-binding MarR family transcriptional regulator